MKQYRITAGDFVFAGETGDADAVMDPTDLARIKQLAGIMETAPVSGGLQGAVAGMMDNVPNSTEYGTQSPVGSSISYTAQERRDLEREYHAKPGTDLWFLINFTKPFSHLSPMSVRYCGSLPSLTFLTCSYAISLASVIVLPTPVNTMI